MYIETLYLGETLEEIAIGQQLDNNKIQEIANESELENEEEEQGDYIFRRQYGETLRQPNIRSSCVQNFKW